MLLKDVPAKGRDACYGLNIRDGSAKEKSSPPS